MSEKIVLDFKTARALELPPEPVAPVVTVDEQEDAEFAAYKENYMNTTLPDPRKYRNPNVSEEQRDAWLRWWFCMEKYGSGSPESKAAYKHFNDIYFVRRG
jgi:hypothetical protein